MGAGTRGPPDRRAERDAMVRTQLERPADGREPVRDPRVLAAMARVPRHAFVPARLQDLAYADRPLPIGEGQTISQPYIVASMVEALELGPDSRVLEVGAGSGYQAAVLAELTPHVVALEVVPALATRCQERLERLGYGDRVQVLQGDGSLGWPAGAPYDGIVVACAAPRVPPALEEQLAEGGHLVLPVGPRAFAQQLLRITREGPERWRREAMTAVVFVPMTHGAPP